MSDTAGGYPVHTQLLTEHPISYIDAGSGPILLLVHGSLCDLRYWRWQVAALSSEYRVIAPSLPGYWPHPFKQADPHFTVAQHASDLIQLMDALAPGQSVHVLGHSRGAHVALEMALRRTPTSLILADPAVGVGDTGPTPEFQEQAVSLLADGDVDRALEGFIDAVNGPRTWRSMTGWFKEMVRDNAGTLLSQVQEPRHPVDAVRLTGLQCPVLLLGAEHSPPRYAQAMDSLQTVVTHAQRDVIQKAAHGMNLGNAPAFNARVRRFLSSSR